MRTPVFATCSRVILKCCMSWKTRISSLGWGTKKIMKRRNEEEEKTERQRRRWSCIKSLTCRPYLVCCRQHPPNPKHFDRCLAQEQWRQELHTLILKTGLRPLTALQQQSAALPTAVDHWDNFGRLMLPWEDQHQMQLILGPRNHWRESNWRKDPNKKAHKDLTEGFYLRIEKEQ